MLTNDLKNIYEILSDAIKENNELTVEELIKKVQEDQNTYEKWKRHNFNLSVKDDHDKTLLQYAIYDINTFDLESIAESIEKCKDILNWLKKHGYEVDTSDRKCLTSCKSSYTETKVNEYERLLEILFEDFQADLSSYDDEVYALEKNYRHGFYEWDKLFNELYCLLSDTNQNKAKTTKEYLLHKAVEKGNAGAVKFLLEEGKDPDEKNIANKTPRELAEEMGNAEIVTLLEQAKLGNTAPNTDFTGLKEPQRAESASQQVGIN